MRYIDTRLNLISDFYLFRVFDYNLENVQRRGEEKTTTKSSI
jgi:hypothetical protein